MVLPPQFAGAARVHPEESAASEAVLMQTAGRYHWGTSPVAVAEDWGTQWTPMEPNGIEWKSMESGTQWNLTIYKKSPFQWEDDVT